MKKNRVFMLIRIVKIAALILILIIIAGCGINDPVEQSSTKVFRSGSGPTATDIDGNIYRTVYIGDQLWMAENLRTTRYNDSTPIPFSADSASWWQPGPAFAWYKNDSAAYKSTYGGYYNGYAVKTGKLAPAGWHVATNADWNELTNFLGGFNDMNNAESGKVRYVGGKLKESGTAHWASPNTGATNETGFSALGGGGGGAGKGGNMDTTGWWWTSTLSTDSTMIWSRDLEYNSTDVGTWVISLPFGFNVRCVKD